MKKKINNGIFYVVISLVAILGVASIVAAYTVSQNINVSGDYNNYEAPAPAVVQPEVDLGAIPGNYFTGPVNFGGEVVYTYTGKFQDATTTIVSIANPFLTATSSAGDVVVSMNNANSAGYTAASTTVDLIRLDITGAATSTFDVSCGASAGWSTADSVSLLDSVATATSTTGILENNLTQALGAADDAGTVVKIALGPTYPYFTCRVSSAYTGAFTEVTNTFDGKYTVRFQKAQ